MPFQPGQSGNPGGRKAIAPELRELAKNACPRAMERCIALMDSDDENVALKAIGMILDRALGKPAQPVDGDGDGGPIRQLVELRFVKPDDKQD